MIVRRSAVIDWSTQAGDARPAASIASLYRQTGRYCRPPSVVLLMPDYWSDASRDSSDESTGFVSIVERCREGNQRNQWWRPDFE